MCSKVAKKAQQNSKKGDKCLQGEDDGQRRRLAGRMTGEDQEEGHGGEQGCVQVCWEEKLLNVGRHAGLRENFRQGVAGVQAGPRLSFCRLFAVKGCLVNLRSFAYILRANDAPHVL